MRTIICRTWKIRLFAVWQIRCSCIGKIPLLFKKLDGVGFAYVFVKQTWLFLFSICTSVNIQLNCRPEISYFRVFHPLFVSHVTRGLSLAYAVTMVTCVVLFMTLPFDSIMESKHNCKSENEENKLVRLYDTRWANKDSRKVARWYERNSSWRNFPLIFYF
jgi:hypothetical protein